MITKETCVQIWNAHREIENCHKILSDLAETLKKDSKKNPTLYNAFGDRVGLQLGVPSGDSSHRIFNVSADLSVAIIEEHIKSQQNRLIELKAIAKLELYAKEADNA
jgi:hypothetical protein